MSRVVTVVAHPVRGSLTLALARAASEAAEAGGASVSLHDLHADGFDPCMQSVEVGTTRFADALTERYAAEVLAADALVIVHPVWFFHVPAALKGWVERVLRDGVVYDVQPGGATRGLLRARSALVVNTANSGPAAEVALGDPVERFWRDVVLGPAGVGRVERLRFSKVDGSTEQERAGWLDEVRRAAASLL